MAAMSVRTLRWVSVIVPTAFVVAFEIITRTVFADVVPSWVHVVVALAAVSLGAFLFSTFVFATIGRLERQGVERKRRPALPHPPAGGTRGAPRGGAAGRELGGRGAPAVPFVPVDGARSLAEYDCECQRALALGRPVVVVD